MARLTNQKTGVVVSTSDDTATRLSSDWAAEKPKSRSKKSEPESESNAE